MSDNNYNDGGDGRYDDGMLSDGGDDDGMNNNNDAGYYNVEDEDAIVDLDALEDDAQTFDTLPPFADKENRSLDALVKQKEKSLVALSEELEDNRERVGIVREHLRNVDQEHKHTQALVDAKSGEIETEDHLKQLAMREVGRITADIAALDKGIDKLQDQCNNAQNATFQANDQLEQFRLHMNWNQEELLQWSLAAKQKDEDQAALEQYKAVDNTKIKHLTLMVEKQTRAVQGKKQDLAAAVTESQSVQIELDKTSQEYRTLHVQRQHLVKQWDEAMKAMQRRDQMIGAAGESISKQRAIVRERQAELDEQGEFLRQQQTNNAQVDVKINNADRIAEKKREQLRLDRAKVAEFQEEVATHRNELNKAAVEVQTAKRQHAHLSEAKEDKEHQLAEFTLLVDATQHTLESEYQNTDDLAKRATQVEQLHKQHTDRSVKLDKELAALKDVMFKRSHELFTLRKKEADLIAEISGAQGTSRNLQARIHELDQRSLKQQEMLYNIEFQVQQLERKVAYASGKRTFGESIILNKRIDELQRELEHQNAQHGMMTQQVKRLLDELRVAKRNYETVVKDKESVTAEIAVIELETSSRDREVKQAIRKKEETMVSHDELRLSAKRLRDSLEERANKVFALENRKLQLQLSIKEREKEIKLHTDVQRADMKCCQEDRHRVTMEMRERQIKVDKLKSKYETIAARLHKAGEEEQTQAYYIIAAAQQREELQREGDELNQTIKKTEKEIRLLNKTLLHLTGRNQAYREGFKKVDVRGPQAKFKAELEEQHRSISDVLYKKKTYLREIVTDFEQRKRILSQLLSNIHQLHGETSLHAQEAASVAAQLEEQQQILEQTSAQVKQQHQAYRQRKGLAADDESVEEVHIVLQEAKLKNKAVLNLMSHFSRTHSLEQQVAATLQQYGMSLADAAVAGGDSGGSSSSSSNFARPLSSMSNRSSSRQGKQQQPEEREGGFLPPI